MDDVISKLTAAKALKIVERLGRKGGKIREAVLTEAMNVLTAHRPTCQALLRGQPQDLANRFTQVGSVLPRGTVSLQASRNWME